MDKHQKKSPLNEKNKYNHNFSGQYCTCDKKFPPDENDNSSESNDEMWQCIVCEDWYHTKHLNVKVHPSKFDEFICGCCVDKLDFVHYYKNILNDKEEEVKRPANVPSAVDQKAEENAPNNGEAANSIETELNVRVNTESLAVGSETEKCKGTNNICESDTNDSQAENKDPGHEISANQPKVECILDSLKREHDFNKKETPESSSETKVKPSKGPLFWSDCTWRSKLCRCQMCLDMYKAKECEYLLDDKDTIQYYEAQGKANAKNNESFMERGMSALNRMNRTAVVEALHGYDELKADLSDYLRKFADTKKVVREEDIHEFFQQLKSKKRQKLEYS